VLVGDVGMNIGREHFYKKELDLRMSTSYGPGRYDRNYEERGQDYPHAYVPWTLNRNMAAYMDLISSGRLNVSDLIDRVVPVGEAPGAYASLAAGGEDAPLGVLLHFPDDERRPAGREAASRISIRGHARPVSGALRYALVGAGAFGTSMLVPAMQRRKDRFFLRGVVDTNTVAASNFARANRVEVLAAGIGEILEDPGFDLVVIATRHNSHAEQARAALEAGKHVFVEKPLALTWEELHALAECYERLENKPLLMVGFNRRFSPAMQVLEKTLEGRRSPLIVNYRLNGGYIPLESWIQGEEGGGRNLGEACHMYDVFRFLAGAPAASISATAINPGGLPYRRDDNFAATIGFEDGSVGNLVYTALGPKAGLAKERVEVFCDGEALVVDDYLRLTRSSDGKVLWEGETQDKGHFEELSRFGDAIARGGPPPIPWEELVETTGVSLRVQDLLFSREEPGA